jgi:hypothetical protein
VGAALLQVRTVHGMQQHTDRHENGGRLRLAHTALWTPLRLIRLRKSKLNSFDGFRHLSASMILLPTTPAHTIKQQTHHPAEKTLIINNMI